MKLRIMMKRLLLATLFLPTCGHPLMAQTADEPFRAYLINNEYEVYMRIDFHHESVIVPDQELYGALPGYLGKQHNSFCWLITSAKVKGHEARLAMINDYGSDDLTATLTLERDSIYVLRQTSGSQLKVPRKGKWQKLPKVLEFVRR